MAGHSKWSNIKHKKEASDAKRAKIFTKIGKEIGVAVKDGGADPTTNAKLRDIIAKAKANNVPNDNINRMIQKYSGTGDDSNYESMTYEGYGPAGVAVIVETLTDNKNRTAAEVRHYFDKNGGNLGQANCVSWQFDRKGLLIIENTGQDEDMLMIEVLEAGAEDFSSDEDMFEIITAHEEFGPVREALEDKYEFAEAEVRMLPQNYVSLESEEDVKRMRKLLDMLDDNEDVQNVWHNWDE